MCAWWVTFFFFNDTATTEIYTLSLHDALPIYPKSSTRANAVRNASKYLPPNAEAMRWAPVIRDRKSTRLNSSHANISYAVFCLKKKHAITGGRGTLAGPRLRMVPDLRPTNLNT